jgi:Domain of unknown function (DUF4296)
MKRIIFGLAILFFVSCSGKTNVPADMIPPLKMQQILMDVLIVDAVNSEKAGADTSIKLMDVNSKSVIQVLKSHNISVKEFSRSYDFYLSHPDVLKPIADSLAALVTKRSTEIYSDTSNPKLNGSNIQKIKR